jgi:hypothetical protein
MAVYGFLTDHREPALDRVVYPPLYQPASARAGAQRAVRVVAETARVNSFDLSFVIFAPWLGLVATDHWTVGRGEIFPDPTSLALEA